MSITKTRRKVAVKRLPIKKEKKTSVKKTPLSGLCTTCAHSAGCGYRSRHNQPVIWCEEFESISAPLIEEASLTAEKGPTATEIHEWDKYKGLCVNCDNRETCQIRDKEIGVWHCEEYR